MEEEAEKRTRLAPLTPGGGEEGEEKNDGEGGGREGSIGESTTTSVKAARRPKRDR